jgi:hypothetical protein
MTTDFKRDGIGYSINVASKQGAFSATWTCNKCKVSGPPTQACERAEDAIARAQARSFSEHHFDRHVTVSAAAIMQVVLST